MLIQGREFGYCRTHCHVVLRHFSLVSEKFHLHCRPGDNNWNSHYSAHYTGSLVHLTTIGHHFLLIVLL